MELHWSPVGPEPASTYWQRRAAVAGGLLLLVLLPSLLLGGDEPETLATSGTAGPSASAAPSAGASISAGASASAGPSASSTASPSPSAPVACAPTALQVEPAAGESSYPVGTTPRLALSITNTAAAPCTRDLGPAQVELTVTSGADRIWSSDDCAPGGRPDVVVLAPGEAVVQRVTWNGRRSLPGCAGDKAPAEAGTYRVSGRVGEQRVEGGSFRLTG